MIFHVSFTYSMADRDTVHERFRQTGAPPPSGVTMVGRWHCTDGNRGYLIAESDKSDAVARWLHEWTDIVAFDVSPVLTDEQFTHVIGG